MLLISIPVIKGACLTKYISASVLLALLIILTPISTLAQGRLFFRDDSGVSVTFDLHSWKSYGKPRDSSSLRVTYTYKGRFDLGVGHGGLDPDGIYYDWFFLGKAVLIDPGARTGSGLELGGRYGRTGYDYTVPWPNGTSQILDQYMETALRGFHRRGKKPKSGIVYGLSLFFRFNKGQYRDTAGDVLLGRDYGEWGGAADWQILDFGFLHFAIRLEYAQDKEIISNEHWRFLGTWSLGFSFGRDNRKEGAHE